MAELTCPHCGATVDTVDVYCPNCTRSLRLSAPETAGEPPHVHPTRTVGWIVGLGVVGLCALAVFPLLIVPAMRVRSTGFAPMGSPPPGTAPGCMANLKQLAVASMIYASDYDDTLFHAAKFDAALMPYTKNVGVFSCPDTGRPYAANKELLGKKLAKVGNPAAVPMLYEGSGQKLSSAHSGGSHVAFADSHVKRVSATTKLNWKP